MSSAHTGLFAGLAATIVGMTVCYGGDAILSGSVVSAAGEKLGGVTVSAKPTDGTITTTVFTDEAGDYFFPPLPAGNYRVWAQAVTFRTAKAELALPPAKTTIVSARTVELRERPHSTAAPAARYFAGLNFFIDFICCGCLLEKPPENRLAFFAVDLVFERLL